MNKRDPITRLLRSAVFGAALLLPVDPTPAQIAPQEATESRLALPVLKTAYAADPALVDADLTVAQTATAGESTPDRDVQRPADAPSDDVAGLTPVVVIGSHIGRSEIEGPQPVDVIRPDLIERVGGVKLGDPRSDYHSKNRARMGRFHHALLGREGPTGDQWFNPFGLAPENDTGLVGWIRVSTRSKLDTVNGRSASRRTAWCWSRPRIRWRWPSAPGGGTETS
jgi:hypothetical protein